MGRAADKPLAGGVGQCTRLGEAQHQDHAGRKVVDGWLAGSLAVLAVEGVIADAFVARSCS
jgi:hypothetical protein